MIIEKSVDMEIAINLAWDMGEVAKWHYAQPTLLVVQKPDGTIATAADLEISDHVVAFYNLLNRKVVSEEVGRTAPYGSSNAYYLDPIDGTDDFEAAHQERRPSIAGFSLGEVIGGNAVRGVIHFPLLATPRLYWAEDGQTFRVMTRGGEEEQCLVDTEAKRGIVLVSENPHPYKERLTKMGFDVVSLGGAVFKAACVADPRLLGAFVPKLSDQGPVVGFLSSSAQAHDYAAACRIVANAGGFTGPLPLTAGKHGCAFANTEQNRDLLLEALNS